MMVCHRVDCEGLPVEAHVSTYRPESGAVELNIMVSGTSFASLDAQLNNLLTAYDKALASVGTDRSTTVFKRIFCSDLSNQKTALHESPLLNGHGAISIVGQAPVGPAKVAMWAYHVIDPDGPLNTERNEHTFSLQRNGLTHHLSTNLTDPDSDDAYKQSEKLLSDYMQGLESRDMTLADNLVRTWFFVHDVDLNYAGLVDARRKLFDSHGLTAHTHYTASTGIGGDPESKNALVLMDAWAIEGLKSEQVRYLKALDHLSPTNIYGVTFERATAISYRRRTHILVSGTASIDDRGKIVHPGDVEGQLDRALENVDALLAEADAHGEDMSHWIVYLRDDSDEPRVREQMRQRHPDTPMIFVHAPVCRPGWLVEVEGIAIVPGDASTLPEF